MSEESGRLRRVGVLWKPRPGAKSKGSGSITINGLKQRFVILPNDHRREGSKDPDYVLLSGDEPEVDSYAAQRSAPAATPAPAAPRTREEGWEPTDADLPF